MLQVIPFSQEGHVLQVWQGVTTRKEIVACVRCGAYFQWTKKALGKPCPGNAASHWMKLQLKRLQRGRHPHSSISEKMKFIGLPSIEWHVKLADKQPKAGEASLDHWRWWTQLATD
eukprot:4894169-Prorocentrum_lima.AAC.1